MDAVVPPCAPRLCGMPDLARSFNDVAEAYDLGRPRYDDHAIAAIAAAAGGGPRLLDVGAGTGRLSAPLLEQGFDVVAVEPLDEMRAILTRAIGPDRALAGRAEALPLPDASVDGAVCSDAWHWFDGARAADELARVVRPGGGVVVCVTYPRWFGSDDAPDWWLDLGVVHTALPKGDHPALVSGWREPDIFEGQPAFEEMQTREESFVHHTDREGIVAHWASMSFVAALPEDQRTEFLGQLDRMLARRGVEAVDIPYRVQLWITRRRPAPAPPADPRAAAS
jgi:SAM-dependent methyltransferase